MPFGRDMPYGRDGLRPINCNLNILQSSISDHKIIIANLVSGVKGESVYIIPIPAELFFALTIGYHGFQSPTGSYNSSHPLKPTRF
jgi:hypothetical protein